MANTKERRCGKDLGLGYSCDKPKGHARPCSSLTDPESYVEPSPSTHQDSKRPRVMGLALDPDKPPAVAFSRALKSGRIDFIPVTDAELLSLADEIVGYLARKAREAEREARANA